MSRFIFATLYVMLLVFNTFGQWEKLNEGVKGYFCTIDFVNETIGWIAGTEGALWWTKPLLLKTEDGGETWNALVVDGNFAIAMIDFTNDTVGWIIGNESQMLAHKYGYILKTTDGGETWLL